MIAGLTCFLGLFLTITAAPNVSSFSNPEKGVFRMLPFPYILIVLMFIAFPPCGFCDVK